MPEPTAQPPGNPVVEWWVVAGRRNQRHPGVGGCHDGGLQASKTGGATEGHVGHVSTVHDRIIQSGDDRRPGTTAGVAHAYRHEHRIRGYPGNANSIDSAYGDAGHESSVSMGVAWIVVVVAGIPAVAVVIDAITSNFAGIHPEDWGQIGMTESRTGIENRNDHIGVTGGSSPSVEDVDVGVGRATGLTGILQAPLVGKQWLLRQLVDVVGLNFEPGATGYVFCLFGGFPHFPGRCNSDEGPSKPDLSHDREASNFCRFRRRPDKELTRDNTGRCSVIEADVDWRVATYTHGTDHQAQRHDHCNH